MSGDSVGGFWMITAVHPPVGQWGVPAARAGLSWLPLAKEKGLSSGAQHGGWADTDGFMSPLHGHRRHWPCVCRE